MKYSMPLPTGLFRGDPEARIFAIQKKEIPAKMIVLLFSSVFTISHH